MIRDTLTHVDLTIYPEIALVIFVGVFFVTSLRAMRRGSKQEAQYASRMPLDEGVPVSVHPSEDRASRGGA